MNTQMKMILASLVSLQLVACGGGGGGGGASEGGSASQSAEQSNTVTNNTNNEEVAENDVATVSYTPSGELLMSQAQESNELYVEESFSFGSSEQVSLQITAADSEANPLTYTRVSVYLVPAEIEEWSDENMDQASLIGSGATNASGLFQRVLDVPQYDAQFLVVLHTVGIENKALLAINSESLSHHFQ